jgi:hypothetical protein
MIDTASGLLEEGFLYADDTPTEQVSKQMGQGSEPRRSPPAQFVVPCVSLAVSCAQHMQQLQLQAASCLSGPKYVLGVIVRALTCKQDTWRMLKSVAGMHLILNIKPTQHQADSTFGSHSHNTCPTQHNRNKHVLLSILCAHCVDAGAAHGQAGLPTAQQVPSRQPGSMGRDAGRQ